MANLKNSSSGSLNSNGNQSVSSSSTSPSSSGCGMSLVNAGQHSQSAYTNTSTIPLVDPWIQATQFHQFSNFINQQAAYSQFFPNFSQQNPNSGLLTTNDKGPSCNK